MERERGSLRLYRVTTWILFLFPLFFFLGVIVDTPLPLLWFLDRPLLGVTGDDQKCRLDWIRHANAYVFFFGLFMRLVQEGINTMGNGFGFFHWSRSGQGFWNIGTLCWMPGIDTAKANAYMVIFSPRRHAFLDLLLLPLFLAPRLTVYKVWVIYCPPPSLLFCFSATVAFFTISPSNSPLPTHIFTHRLAQFAHPTPSGIPPTPASYPPASTRHSAS